MSFIRDIGESLGDAVLENVGRAMGRAQERTPLPVDLLEGDDEYLAVFDAPGAEAGDVQVQYRHGAVEVRIDRFRGFREGFDMRYPGRGLSLDGRVELPSDGRVDAGAASAALRDNGTLEVRVPKRADAESTVSVDEGSSEPESGAAESGDPDSDDAEWEPKSDDADGEDGDDQAGDDEA